MAKTAQYLPNNKKSLAEDHGKLWPSQGDIMGIGEDDWQPPMMEFVNEGDHVPPKASMLLTEMSLNRE